MGQESNGSFRRQVIVLTATVVAVSFVGFVLGTRPLEVPAAATPAVAAPAVAGGTAAVGEGDGTPPAAKTWKELQAEPYWSRKSTPQSLSALRPVVPSPDTPIELHPELKAKSLADRAFLRAYDGAPPMVPHPVPQRGGLPCLVCHEAGAVVGELRAPGISHEKYSSCTQCHVPMNGVFTPEEELAYTMGDNTFAGVKATGQGTRAWKGAPPTIPHPTLMRSRCASCHGPAGREGLQTSHPWRQSCTQCHGLSAGLDQRPGLRDELAPPWAAEGGPDER